MAQPPRPFSFSSRWGGAKRSCRALTPRECYSRIHPSSIARLNIEPRAAFRIPQCDSRWMRQLALEAFSEEKTNTWNFLAVKMRRSRQCEDFICSFIHGVSGKDRSALLRIESFQFSGVGAELSDFESLQLTARFVNFSL